MDMGNPSSFGLLVVLVLSSAASLAHGSAVLGIKANAAGVVACSADGNPVAGGQCSGVPGANVTLTCNEVTTILAGALTDTGGRFNLGLKLRQHFGQPWYSLLGGQCVANVALSTASATCTLLPRKGSLQATVSLNATQLLDDALNGSNIQLDLRAFVAEA